MLEFKNYKDLMAQLKDEKVCRETMGQWRWNGSPFCPQCNGTKPYKLKDGKTYRCREKTCRKDFTSYCASYINKNCNLEVIKHIIMLQ